MEVAAVVVPASASATHRFHALDGLRGVAAAVVVIHHSLLVIPSLGDLWARDGSAVSGSAWLITHTPLHLLWAGEEAVFVFFVLSGFVLALPAVQRRMRWGPYYPKRFVRLYLPVWASLAVAIALVSAVPRRPQLGASAWLNGRHPILTAGEVLHDAIFVRSNQFEPVLRSLRWEIIFSISLPLFVLLGTMLRSTWVLKLATLRARGVIS